MRATLLIAAAGIVGLSHTALAQSGAERFRVSVNGAVQVTARTASQKFSLTKNLESAPIGVDISLASAPLFDVGGSVRLVHRLAVGVAVSSLSRTVDGSVDAKIAHPFFFNAPRSVAGTLSNLKQSERAVHVAAVYFIPLPHTLEIGVFGGPSRFSVKQDLVTDVAYTDSYPFDAATFASATTTSISKTGMGYNVGVDVGWRLSKTIGIGGLIRLTRASTTLSVSAGNTVAADLGGLQTGAGVRLIF